MNMESREPFYERPESTGNKTPVPEKFKTAVPVDHDDDFYQQECFHIIGPKSLTFKFSCSFMALNMSTYKPNMEISSGAIT